MLAHHALSTDPTSAILEAYRAIVIGIGAFTLGLGFYLLWAYWRQLLWPQRPYNVRSHVLAIISSYLLLLGSELFDTLTNAVNRAPVTWRLPLSSVAFPVGAYALWQIAAMRAKEKRPTPSDD